MLHCIFFNPAYQLSTEPRQCQRWQEEGSFQLPIQDPFFSAGDLGRTWIGLELEAWIGSWRRALAAAPLFVLCATVPACLAQGQSHRLHSNVTTSLYTQCDQIFSEKMRQKGEKIASNTSFPKKSQFFLVLDQKTALLPNPGQNFKPIFFMFFTF